MRMPRALRSLDDRVLGSGRGDAAPAGPGDGEGDGGGHHVQPAGSRPATRTGDGPASVLRAVWRVARLVLLALALVLVVAVAFTLLPTNEDNVIVRNVLSLAGTVAGPFQDVFQLEDDERERIANYGLAAVVYLVLSSVVGKLPTGRRKA
jgi:hypothetical protein